jgi:hypothetical protein
MILLEDHISNVGFEFEIFKMQDSRVYGQTLGEKGECLSRKRVKRGREMG